MTAPSRYRRSVSRVAGFTLVEVLVVIAIVTLLVGIVSPAVIRSKGTANQLKIKVEVEAIDQGFRIYKQQFGLYPPCEFDKRAAVVAHLALAFPCCNPQQSYTDLAKVVDTSNPRPDQDLVLWLNGFNADVTQPFFQLNTIPRAQRARALFNFDNSGLVPLPGNSGLSRVVPSYIPPGVKKSAPYLYIQTDRYGSNYNNFYAWDPVGAATSLKSSGFAAVYLHDVDGNGVFAPGIDGWPNADSFQIVSTSGDGLYGSTVKLNGFATATKRLYPTGPLFNPKAPLPPGADRIGYDLAGADDDNITNFCPKVRLADARP